MECFYRSKSFREEGKPILGSRKTIFTEGKERGMSESMEQLENTVEGESQEKRSGEQDVTVDAETIETSVRTVEEEINDAEDSISDTEGYFNEEDQAIVEQLKKLMLKERTGNGIMFKKVIKKVLNLQTDRVIETIKYLKSKSITETNNLICAASVWMAKRIGLKKEPQEYRSRNEPIWKRRIQRDIRD